MNEEIKEILDRLDFNEWEIDLYKVPITWAEMYDIRDYITNLQEENEKLKEQLQQEKKDFKEANDYCFELKDYKSRNKKAIEYIETHYLNSNEPELLNILTGGDKE